VRAWVARIGRTAERAVALIDDLLAYTSVGRGQHAHRPVDLAVLAREVVDEQTSSGTRPARFAFGDLPVVTGDEALLRQLLGNLVGNALKYVPADRAAAVLVDALDGPDPGHCVLRVSDNGDGFAPDEQERVFEMFQRGQAAVGLPGTGIGLAICRRVAEHHGGRIWVEARPGGGSRVCTRLPLAPCAGDRPPQN
jgi:signal transduction histidine kinase